jgi:hypothetical protein
MVLESADWWYIVHYYLMFNKVNTFKIIRVFIIKDVRILKVPNDKVFFFLGVNGPVSRVVTFHTGPRCFVSSGV